MRIFDISCALASKNVRNRGVGSKISGIALETTAAKSCNQYLKVDEGKAPVARLHVNVDALRHWHVDGSLVSVY